MSSRAFWLALVSLLLVVPTTYSYSNSLPCFVEFDEDEVVMNHHIIPVEKADTKLALQVRQKGGDTWWTSSSSDKQEFEIQPGTVYEARFDLRGSQIDEEEFDAVMEVSVGGSFAADATAHCEDLRAIGPRNRNIQFTVDGTNKSVTLVGAWALKRGAVTLSLPAKLRVSARANEEL